MPKKLRIIAREFLFWFTFEDYKRFKNANYHIVSLGTNCLPRVLTTAIKLKPRRFYGEKSCTFDLSVNKDLKKITHLIENDFKDFFNNIIVNKENFPHDYKLSHKNFVIRYQNRIKNFINIMQSDKIIYFIHSDYTKVPAKNDILNLYRVLENKRNGKLFKLIILTSEFIEGLQENIIQIPENFTPDNAAGGVYLIDEYKEFDNKYTKFREIMKNKLNKTLNLYY